MYAHEVIVEERTKGRLPPNNINVNEIYEE
jgi:hypothetical protein